MSQFNFNSKETYLAYRADWKLRYKKLSAEIRQHKLEIKEAQRNGTHTGSMEWRRQALARQATQMLQELDQAKLEAQRQYLASKASEGPQQA